MATVRSGLAAVVLLALFAAAACSSGASSDADRPTANRPAAGRPNFVLIVTDDLATGDLGAMPNLRALVTDEGVSFSDYFVSVSLCCPSRTSMWRGQYAHNTGVLTNEGVTGGFPVAYERGLEDSTLATWLQSLQALDRQLTTLVDTLRENGQLDNTYPVFTSDNGFHLGQHRLSGGKQTAYEEDINLPLLVRGPNVPRGQTSDALVGNIDLAPTFAALAGAPAADFVDGRSFADQLHDPGANLERESFLLEHWQVERGSSTAADGSAPSAAAATAIPTTGDAGFEGFGESPSPPEYRGVRTVRYTYVEYDTDEVELYDNIDDPDQLHNLAAIADQALLDRLSERVAALADCQADACRTAEDVEVPEP